MSWNGTGKVRAKRSRSSKPYERVETRGSWLGKVTNTVAGLLPAGWVPSWLSEDTCSSSGSVSSAVPISAACTATLRPSLRTATSVVDSGRHVSFQEIEPAAVTRATHPHSSVVSSLPSVSSASSGGYIRPEFASDSTRDESAAVTSPAVFSSGQLSSDVVSTPRNRHSRSELSSQLLQLSSAPCRRANEESGSLRLFTSASRPVRFSPSALNTSLQQLDKSVDCSVDGGSTSESVLSRTFCGALPSSPYYPGPTKYGGAASQRLTLQHRSRPSLQRSARAGVTRAASAMGRSDAGSLSSSSRRILDALQKMSTPLSEARASAASTFQSARVRDVPSGKRSCLYGAMGARLGAAGRPVPQTTPQSERLLLKAADSTQRAAVAVEDAEQRRAKHFLFSSDTPVTPTGGGKMQRSREVRHYKTSTPLTTHEQTPLAGISLGAGISLKPLDAFSASSAATAGSNFDFSLPEVLPAPSSEISSGSLKILPSTMSYTFRSPSSVDSVIVLARSSVSSESTKSLSNRINGGDSLTDITTSSAGRSYLTERNSSVVTSSHRMRPTGSIACSEAHVPLVSAWKTGSTNWTCGTCLLSNAVADSSCVACQTPRCTADDTSNIGKSVISSKSALSESNAQWECDTCLLRNEASLNKCAACESSRPVSSKPDIVKSNECVEAVSTAKTPQWECDVCLVWNSCSDAKCVACQSLRSTPSAKPGSSSAASFVFGSDVKPVSSVAKCNSPGFSSALPVSTSTSSSITLPPAEVSRSSTGVQISFTPSSPTKLIDGTSFPANDKSTSLFSGLSSANVVSAPAVTAVSSVSTVLDGFAAVSAVSGSAGSTAVSDSTATTGTVVSGTRGSSSSMDSTKRIQNIISSSNSSPSVTVSISSSSSVLNHVSSFSVTSSNSISTQSSVSTSAALQFPFGKSAPEICTSTPDVRTGCNESNIGSTSSSVANPPTSVSSFSSSLNTVSSLPSSCSSSTLGNAESVKSKLPFSLSTPSSSTSLFTFGAGNSTVSQGVSAGFSFGGGFTHSPAASSNTPVVTSSTAAPFVFGQSAIRAASVAPTSNSAFSAPSGPAAPQMFASSATSQSAAAPTSQSLFTFGAKPSGSLPAFSFGHSNNSSMPTVTPSAFVFGQPPSAQSGVSCQSASAGQPVFQFQGAGTTAPVQTGFNFGAAAAPASSFNFSAASGVQTGVFQFGSAQSHPTEAATPSVNPFDSQGSVIGNRRIKTARRRLKK